MLATVLSAALVGVDAEPVQIEVSANEAGEPRLVLVGLPDAAVRESANRVCSALASCGFHPLRTRTTINLAPGHLRKEGPIYDLPIALALLVASGQIRSDRLGDYLIAGELGLSGATRPVRGGLAMSRLARRLGKRGMLLPGVSADEAALVEGTAVYEVASLHEAAKFLSGAAPLPAARASPVRPAPDSPGPDFSEIKGQPALRRAVEVAVSGGHNLLML